MNMLIIGVLFIVALLAIGGAVWLSIGERQANGRAAAATMAAPAAPAVAAPGQQVPAAATSGQQGMRAPARPAATPALVPVEPDERVSPESTAPAAHREQPFPALNGQFYELATELRRLHGEAQDIERRLSMLTEMVNRIEREYGEVGLEAE